MNIPFADIHAQYPCIQQGVDTAIADMFAGYGQASDGRALWGATRIGNQVSNGSNATLLPATICDDVVVGAGSAVTCDIAVLDVYTCDPARRLRSNSRTAGEAT